MLLDEPGQDFLPKNTENTIQNKGKKVSFRRIENLPATPSYEDASFPFDIDEGQFSNSQHIACPSIIIFRISGVPSEHRFLDAFLSHVYMASLLLILCLEAPARLQIREENSHTTVTRDERLIGLHKELTTCLPTPTVKDKPCNSSQLEEHPPVNSISQMRHQETAEIEPQQLHHHLMESAEIVPAAPAMEQLPEKDCIGESNLDLRVIDHRKARVHKLASCDHADNVRTSPRLSPRHVSTPFDKVWPKESNSRCYRSSSTPVTDSAAGPRSPRGLHTIHACSIDADEQVMTAPPPSSEPLGKSLTSRSESIDYMVENKCVCYLYLSSSQFDILRWQS
jgi:hypothetical protein